MSIDRQTWEREIMDLLIKRMEIPNGDAQGIFEAHPFEVAQEWSKGSSSSEVADRLIRL